APIYDCGSCLFPQADDVIMQATIDNEDERNLRVFEIPLSGIKVNGKKINYHDFIFSLNNEDCNKALKRILPKIDMEEINLIIDETPYFTELQKKFYKTILMERKEKILDVSFEKLRKRELAKQTE
ncbi:MAG: CtkA family protein, partial [Lachnospira sp.]|nr:CtkA family protein [Lachnospira sp.]